MNVTFLDAPVAGGAGSAMAGTVTMMASGSDEACEKGRPLLEAVSPKVIRVSNRVGDGPAIKLVNNSINAGFEWPPLNSWRWLAGSACRKGGHVVSARQTMCSVENTLKTSQWTPFRGMRDAFAPISHGRGRGGITFAPMP